MNERAIRAYLTLVAEPGDEAIGTLVRSFGAQHTLGVIENHPRYAPRMPHGGNLKKIADWHAGIEMNYGVRFLIPGDAKWPTMLDDLGDTAPIGLWVRGDAQVLADFNGPAAIGVVGARAATSYGEHVTQEIVTELVGAGCPIVSGAAYGIDGAAHRAAMTAGARTVAYLAGGVDRPYPAGHAGLIERILQTGGATVSEVPPGSTPTRYRFLARNRLIAASTAVTLVVEAGFRSGSLNTAGHAHRLGRHLAAVPGPITSAASAGCHRIIREQGATLVTSAQEVLEIIGLRQVQPPVTLAGEPLFG